MQAAAVAASWILPSEEDSTRVCVGYGFMRLISIVRSVECQVVASSSIASSFLSKHLLLPYLLLILEVMGEALGSRRSKIETR